MADGAPGARDRMILSSALLVRERGARATSLDRVLEHSGAPRGSVYHHFPGGRDELLGETVALAERYVLGLLADHGSDPLAAFDALTAAYREDLADSGLRSGCPVAAIALEHQEGEETVQARAGEAFSDWQRAIAALLVEAGLPRARAARLADTAIASFEGALLLARSRRSLDSFDHVTTEIRGLIEASLPESE